MAIENKLTKSRKTQAVQALGSLSHSKGGSECRLHHHNRVVEAPAWIGVLAGAKIRTAEAVRTVQVQYRAFGCGSQGDSQ